MKNQHIVLLTTTLLILFFTEFSYSQSLTAANGYLYFKDHQILWGNNDAAFTFKSNNSDVTRLVFTDKENDVYGQIYGGSNGTHFGFLDGNSKWSYLAVKDNYTAFRIKDSEKMRIRVDGNVGIGTDNPLSKLHVDANPLGELAGDKSILSTFEGSVGNSSKFQILNLRNSNGPNWYSTSLRLQRVVDATAQAFIDFGIEGNNASYGLAFGTRDSYDGTQKTRMVIEENGNVAIGTTNPQHKLDVCGTIRAQEVIVEEGWCDYVFEPEYCLTTLEEEADFIQIYGHLSNFESAEKMDGLINVNDIFKRQQIQIEENVLHLIELNEENSFLQNEVNDLSAEVEHLTEKINSLTTNYERLAKELAAIKAQLR